MLQQRAEEAVGLVGGTVRMIRGSLHRWFVSRDVCGGSQPEVGTGLLSCCRRNTALWRARTPPALGVELPFTERLLRASYVLRAVAGLGCKPMQLVLDLRWVMWARFSDLSFLVWRTGVIAFLTGGGGAFLVKSVRLSLQDPSMHGPLPGPWTSYLNL